MSLSNYSDFQFMNDSSIIATSRIVLEEGGRVHRIVFRKLNGKEYVTHMENLLLDDHIWSHGDFYDGHYFFDNATKAVSDFNDRCLRL